MNSNLIYDVGLHTGEDTEFYLRKGFHVVAIEANPELCNLAHKRFRCYIDQRQLAIVNVAIAETSGPKSFFRSDGFTAWSTSNRAWAEWYRNVKGATFTEIVVEALPFQAILERFGIPYYLKVDIEGTDILCLKGLLSFSQRPRCISIEAARTSLLDVKTELSLFRALGYSKFKFSQQLDVTKQKCPFPAREGRFTDHQFEPGSSGLFGNELPGLWLSPQQARRAAVRIFYRHKLFGENGICRRYRLGRSLLARLDFTVGWHDIHVTV